MVRALRSMHCASSAFAGRPREEDPGEPMVWPPRTALATCSGTMTLHASTAALAGTGISVAEPLDAFQNAAAKAAAFLSGLGGQLTSTGLGTAPSPRYEVLARHAPAWLKQKLADRAQTDEEKKQAVANYLHLRSSDFRDIEDKRNDLLWAHSGLTDVGQILRLNPVAAECAELRAALVCRYNDSIDTLTAGGTTINASDKLLEGQTFEGLKRQTQQVLAGLNKRLAELNGCYDRSIDTVRSALTK
jgi:hypothetical protein